MNKTEARQMIKRVREGLRELDNALTENGIDYVKECIDEINGAAAQLYDYIDERGA